MLIQLDNDQQAALEMMLRGRNVFLTGEAGTGKSALLREFRRQCTHNVAFLAPTGISAINVEGSTIHSFFQFKPVLLSPETIDEIAIPKKRRLVRSVKTIVIDEISMVRSDLFFAIDYRLRQLARGGSAQRPFGGKQIIVVGDFFQLPPIVKGEKEESFLRSHYGGVYPFETELWEKAEFRSVMLRTIHRQQGEQRFMHILNDIRHNNLSEENIRLDSGEYANVVDALNELCCRSNDIEPLPVYLCTTNREAESYNALCQNALDGRATIFKAVVSGNFPEQEYPTLATLSIQVGARIMVLVNKRNPDGTLEYVNGDTGVVQDIASGSPSVTIRLDSGKTSVITPNTWSKYDYVLEVDKMSGKETLTQREVGRFIQLPIKLAYAITIHKSQGMSIDSVFIKLGNGCFAHGQLYTALSRCRRLETLRLERRIFREDVIVDPRVVEFYRNLDEPPQPASTVSLSIPKELEAEVLAYIAQLKQGIKPDATSTQTPTPEIPSKNLEVDNGITDHPAIDKLIKVYRNQTGSEQSDGSTKYKNGVGFNRFDAPILTEIAERYLSLGYITKADLQIVEYKIHKYHSQF